MEILELYAYLGIIILMIIVIYVIRNPTEAFIPYNQFIDSITEKKVFYTEEEKKKIFPTSTVLESSWQEIRDEYFRYLHSKEEGINKGLKEKEDNDNIGKNFIVENEEFWKGWTTIKLKIFGKETDTLRNSFPKLKTILDRDKNIVTAFFSIMEPGKVLRAHYGPFKGILRYHLGLSIPNKELGDCFISVNSEIYEWNNGEGVLFDETYLHFVKNETALPRVILFLDVKRPLPSPLHLLNDFLLFLISISPYNH